ncbi:Protein CBG08735 [Caenorhabditis briggsae]|uniref:Protein CBG08735 n=2 Tax=Caenorhabditis briggsae TaxID=6238 RepID=A8X797_CAEBR|nr:Protein CBG08735 [Caenorhabditis briggsae]ULU14481.1 hypothetical protein L3Y34_016754 [Caenorhabditis briggsae]CAP28508.1 Protein CBG08735 [Caenorhabditis briggsae]
MIIASYEITCFHIFLGILMFGIYLIVHQFYQQFKLRRERKEPNVFDQFEKIPGLHTIENNSHTFYCGAQDYTMSSSRKLARIYKQDRLRVERLLNKLLLGSYIRVPDNTVAVCIPTWCSKIGAKYHEFKCTPPAPYCPCPTILSEFNYTYKMVSGRVQATFYHNRRCTCLAGICIYMRIPNEPWFFGELPEDLIIDLIEYAIKSYSPRRGRRYRHTPPLVPAFRPNAPPIEISSSEEYTDVDEAEDSENERPPCYASVFGARIDATSRIDEVAPPNYFSLFSNSSAL